MLTLALTLLLTLTLTLTLTSLRWPRRATRAWSTASSPPPQTWAPPSHARLATSCSASSAPRSLTQPTTSPTHPPSVARCRARSELLAPARTLARTLSPKPTPTPKPNPPPSSPWRPEALPPTPLGGELLRALVRLFHRLPRLPLPAPEAEGGGAAPQARVGTPARVCTRHRAAPRRGQS